MKTLLQKLARWIIRKLSRYAEVSPTGTVMMPPMMRETIRLETFQAGHPIGLYQSDEFAQHIIRQKIADILPIEFSVEENPMFNPRFHPDETNRMMKGRLLVGIK